MIKFHITPERFATACNVLEYLAIVNGNRNISLRVLPRFIEKDDEYVVGVTLDDDGDIKEFAHEADALLMLGAVNPKRLERLATELTEAAKAIVNP